uniref:Uncharacterized protein n=1 Tax=Nelumbo nucifera TaxID=4432 RepID=A0A822Y325_NELNU|nr:TPA_asm: hypothetical protein HUJ06_028305 [Nelumbo nucifera]
MKWSISGVEKGSHDPQSKKGRCTPQRLLFTAFDCPLKYHSSSSWCNGEEKREKKGV